MSIRVGKYKTVIALPNESGWEIIIPPAAVISFSQLSTSSSLSEASVNTTSSPF